FGSSLLHRSLRKDTYAFTWRLLSMPSECESCASKIRVLSNPIGTLNNPLGVCANCHSLICGWHGHKDRNEPEFICIECDPNLLVASAAVGSHLPGQRPPPSGPGYGYHLYDSPPERWAVKSLDDFFRRRPGYDRASIMQSVKEFRIDKEAIRRMDM